MTDSESDESRRVADIRAFNPAFSPDGTKIAFGSEAPGSEIDDPGCDPEEEECRGAHELYVVNVDGTGLRELTHTRDFEVDPAWSPDGTRLVYNDAGDGGIEILDLDSGDVETITFGYSPDWSPDGERIAFSNTWSNGPDQEYGESIYVIGADGNGQEPVTDLADQAHDSRPSWSPDGERIAFQSYRAGIYGIYTVPADGTGAEQLVAATQDGVNERLALPAFSPDGTKIAATWELPSPPGDGEESDMVVMPAGGGAFARHPVSENPDTNSYNDCVGRLAGPARVGERRGGRARGRHRGNRVGGEPADTRPGGGHHSERRHGSAPGDRPPDLASLRVWLRRHGAADPGSPGVCQRSPEPAVCRRCKALIPAGVTAQTLELTRNGELVPECTDAPMAVPDPCVSARETLAGGDVGITALSLSASAWNLVARDDEPP